MNPLTPSIAIVGAGVAGLITAHVPVRDGFRNVQILTRDVIPGGVWTRDRVYTGLRLKNVHGDSPSEKDGRLTGDDLSAYTDAFASKFLEGKIEYGVEVRDIRRNPSGAGSLVDLTHRATSQKETLLNKETREYGRVVMCIGGCNEPNFSDGLSSSDAAAIGFRGLVLHSADIGPRGKELLTVADTTKGERNPAPVVVAGGGKSAQEYLILANQGQKVTIVFSKFDSFTASSKSMPGWMRKSRLMSVFFPHPVLRTPVERFLHKTSTGKIHDAMDLPRDSPLRDTSSMYWNIRTNDEGIPRANGFHALVNAGKIAFIPRARAERFGSDGQSLVLEDGRSIPASAVVFGTRYKSSWSTFKTLSELGLTAQTTPRASVPTKLIAQRDFAINGAVLSANFGYTNEVAAHWISAYFLEDAMRLLATPADARAEAERAGAWMRARYPQVPVARTPNITGYVAFWNWPQHADDLLEDMGLWTRRSGGNWLTCPFKVVDPEEIRYLKEERDAKRAADVKAPTAV
ncbi:FAD/NAD-P-binding domain-containing protein [Epithele typhae]|uniref:FAD/NAD-P-binding domain-containing protein n=1 Tax=Epithele typhae TaxID=378194 RepID=UPI002008143F|nr:FAD/NAD-P-binding domain-containing protein [Epithele typhae]KAH9939295.1 FAD/NAD-P-binding domain-containing protein [Epithele typhae]